VKGRSEGERWNSEQEKGRCWKGVCWGGKSPPERPKEIILSKKQVVDPKRTTALLLGWGSFNATQGVEERDEVVRGAWEKSLEKQNNQA